MNHSTFNFSSKDGLSLMGRAWLSNQSDIRGMVHLVHGLGEHSGRYAHIAKALNDAGYHLVGFDLRGHGLSEGKRGHSPNLETLLDDVQSFLDEIGKRFGQFDAKFLYGHSLGANIVLNFGLRRSADLSGIIATSPSLRLAFAPPKLKLIMGKVIAAVMPSMLMNNGLEQDALSRDKAIVKAYTDDVLVHDHISTKLAMDLFDSGTYALEHASHWQLPLLLMHGTADRITSSKASQEFAQKAGSPVELVLWEGYYHETHNDLGKQQVIAKMIEWLNQQAKV